MFKPILLIICVLFALSSLAQSVPGKDSTPISADKHPAEIPPASLQIYPNPAKNKISLQVAGFEPGIAKVRITDSRGKIWKEDNRLLTNGQEEIAMFLLLAPGIYFISVSEKNRIARKKLVVL